MYIVLHTEEKPKVMMTFDQKDPAIVTFLNLVNGNSMFSEPLDDVSQFKECIKKLNKNHYVSGGQYALQTF